MKSATQLKILLLIIGIAVVAAVLYATNPSTQTTQSIDYQEFITKVNSGAVRQVTITDNAVKYCRIKQCYEAPLSKSQKEVIIPLLLKKNIAMHGQTNKQQTADLIFSFWPIWLVLLFVIAVFIIIIKMIYRKVIQ